MATHLLPPPIDAPAAADGPDAAASAVAASGVDRPHERAAQSPSDAAQPVSTRSAAVAVEGTAKRTPSGRMMRYCWPMLLASGIAASAAAVGGWAGAAVAAGTLTIGGNMTLRRLDRHRRQARAQIEQSTSSPLSIRRDSYFDDLVAAAEAQMMRLKQSASDSESRSAQAEARIHLARRDVARLQTALAALPTPTILLDGEGQVFAANAAAGEAIPEAKPGEPLPSDGPIAALTETVRRMLARGEQAERQSREFSVPSITRGLPAADADPILESEPPPVRTYVATICPLRSVGAGLSNGRLAGVAISLAETTEREEVKQQCAQFLGAACHELKTPMASIRAHVELLADGDLETPEEQAESLRFIDEQADRLARLVENMLNLSRIQSGLVKVQRVDASLSDVLTPPLELLQTAAEAKQITLRNELSDLYMAVHLDVELFQQAITNLLSNGVKYTPPGGEVRLRSRLDDRHAVIEVQDSGLGIPEESVAKIFDQFYRVPENNHSAPGTGLGLSLVRFIAEDIHSGEIGVRSVVGEGSTFSIRIPLGHRGAKPRVIEEPAEAAS